MTGQNTDRSSLRTYRALAPVYDVVSLERLLYREGRQSVVRAVHLEPGQQVLDVGCGTGLSMPLMSERLGLTGHVIGIDPNQAMLAQAAKRPGAANRTLIQADAEKLAQQTLTEHGISGTIDAALFCYTLSVMPDWARAWDHITALLTSGARVGIVDVAPPTVGGPPTRLLARALTRIGHSNIHSRPWTALQETCSNIEHHVFTGGHVQVWAGNLL